MKLTDKGKEILEYDEEIKKLWETGALKELYEQVSKITFFKLT